MSSIRSFIAIDIPLSIKKSLSDWIEPFRQRDSSIKWVGPEKMHVTLKFLGNVEEERFEKEFYPGIPKLLESFPLFKLVVQDAGQFPTQGIPRVLWAGMQGETESLTRLALKTEDFFERFGFVKEKRPFKSHITLARIKKKPSKDFLQAWQQRGSKFFGEFVVDHLTFYRSKLTKWGAVYSVLKGVKLG